MLDKLDLNNIKDKKALELIRQLLNLMEKLSGYLRDAQVEIQCLRGEVNQLKGEQSKTMLKRNMPKSPTTNHSSGNECHKLRQRHKRKKNAEI